MSLLTLFAEFLIGTFNFPIFRDWIGDRAQQIDTCAGGSCVER